MKLHYFNQPSPDKDDLALLQARAEKLVPPGCLLGGAVIKTKLATTSKLCSECHGPRERCGGDPAEKASEDGRDEERAQLLKLFAGDNPNDPLARILKGR